MTTIISFLLVLPLIAASESLPAMKAVLRALPDKRTFVLNNLLCGFAFYLYNEMQNIVLGSLGPVPTAVGESPRPQSCSRFLILIPLSHTGNTLKRVVIFVALFYFTPGETFPLPKIVGCAIAILGCLAFAVCDSKKL